MEEQKISRHTPKKINVVEKVLVFYPQIYITLILVQ